MSRYIDADDYEVQLKIDNHLNGYTDLARALHILRYQKTVDVRENVKGRWIENDLNATCGFHIPSVKCSICGEIAPCVYGYNYCPNCGADMRGANDD